MKSGLLNIDSSLLLIIDIQEKLLKAQFEKERMARNAATIVQAAKILNIPVILTEQYPQGLGSTIPEIVQHLPDNAQFFTKTSFSCCFEPGFNDLLKKFNRSQIMVCGMESHICVHQSVHNLLEQDLEVHIIQDAITSRREFEYKQGLKRMLHSGAIPSTVETALFELIKCAGHSEFKAIQNLIK